MVHILYFVVVNTFRGGCRNYNGNDPAFRRLNPKANIEDCVTSCKDDPDATGCEWSTGQSCNVFTGPVERGSHHAGWRCWKFISISV